VKLYPNVAGRVAVVTGASRGLGAGLAVHFAASGMHLGLCARHKPSLVVRTRPTAHDGRIERTETPILQSVDVTDRDALARFSDAVVARFGRIDLWINNAGQLGRIGPLADASGDDIAAVVATNVTGVANGSSVFAEHVRGRQGRGVLVNMSSGAATKAYEGWAVYCATKAAVDQLTRVVALEETRHELSAYSVAPGVVDTDMQVAIRAADESEFPEVERFRSFAEQHQFNSPTWVADHILALAFGPDRPESVKLRLPDQGAAAAADTAR
jgi:benzil reductase ((S)-benzoin forming)